MSATVTELPDITFAYVGGHIAVDLLNTVEWRLDPELRIEDLSTYGHVIAWAEQAGVVDQKEEQELLVLAGEHPVRAGRARDDMIKLREDAYLALVKKDQRAADRVSGRLLEALGRSQLVNDGATWGWADRRLDLTSIADRVVVDVVGLLTSESLSLLHQCEDAACGWVYLDTSRRHNRRWCAEDCGNRNRARAYYARKTGRVAAS